MVKRSWLTKKLCHKMKSLIIKICSIYCAWFLKYKKVVKHKNEKELVISSLRPCVMGEMGKLEIITNRLQNCFLKDKWTVLPERLWRIESLVELMYM